MEMRPSGCTSFGINTTSCGEPASSPGVLQPHTSSADYNRLKPQGAQDRGSKMSLEVGPVTKSKNGLGMLDLLYYLSTVADDHSHVAE